MRILFFQDENGLLKRLCLSRPFGTDLVDVLLQKASFEQMPCSLLMPVAWIEKNPLLNAMGPFQHDGTVWDAADCMGNDSEPICLLNGRVVLGIDEQQLRHTLKSFEWDIVTIQVNPDLQSGREILKLTSQGDVVGFRRFYNSSIEPGHAVSQWPDITFFSRSIWRKICNDGGLPLDFDQFRKKVDAEHCRLTHLRLGGRRRPMDNEAAFLDCLQQCPPTPSEPPVIPEGATGLVLTGQNVTIDPGVRLIGPVLLSDDVHVQSGAVIRRSVVADGTTVPAGTVINNRILFHDTDLTVDDPVAVPIASEERPDATRSEYKNWSLFSYAKLGKRVFDIVMSLAVLILLIPVLLVVAVVVKVASPGPLFYRARRQGLHGREFDCLKFRSMMVAADTMQERLRVVNQVDGPQFKMENDPRITGVGRFLRDTCIDELPQFINVLKGEMSVVGPRPSPENENESSPAWRDARLSVRPGITGLWQVLRTRREGADFQEWVYYDTRYVRNLSFRKDLWICWKTAQKLICSFLSQFG